MVAYLKTKILSVSLVVFIFLGASASAQFGEIDVNSICKEAINTSFCSKILRSNPLPELNALGIKKRLFDYVKHDISVTLNLLESIIKSTTDSRAKEIYINDSKNLRTAAGLCDTALKALAGKDYVNNGKDFVTFIDSTGEAFSLTDDCRRDGESNLQYAEKLNVIFNLLDIVKVIG